MNEKKSKIDGRRIFAIIDKVTAYFAHASAACGILLTFVVVTGAVSRYIFNYPLGWRDEISAYIFIFHCFLALAYATYREAHIAAEMVYVHLPSRMQFVITFSGYVLALLCTAIICYYGFETTYEYFIRGWTSDTPYEITLWPIIMMIPLGFLLFGLQCLSRIDTLLHRMKTTGSVMAEEEAGIFGLDKKGNKQEE